MFDIIPAGWFVETLRDVRTPVVYNGDKHVHKYWMCALQWEDGGGRLIQATGSTPEEAFMSACQRAAKWKP